MVDHCQLGEQYIVIHRFYLVHVVIHIASVTAVETSLIDESRRLGLAFLASIRMKENEVVVTTRFTLLKIFDSHLSKMQYERVMFLTMVCMLFEFSALKLPYEL